jgi:HEAT repeat protein
MHRAALKVICALVLLAGLRTSADAGATAAAPASAPAAGNVDRIDAALQRAAVFMVKAQSPDGAWRSETYGAFRDVPVLTPYVMSALFFLPQGGEPARLAFKRGARYLVEHVNEDGTVNEGPRGFNYPVFMAAMASRVVALESRTPETVRAQTAWLAFLRRRQLTQPLGWDYADPEFGGWGFSIDLPRKPKPGELKGLFYESNLPSTLFGLAALKSARVPPDDPAWHYALRFVTRCQNFAEAVVADPKFDDGGFFFIPNDPLQNKAGVAGTDRFGRQRFHSYGAMTADGLRALLQCGLAPDDRRVVAARQWLERHFTAAENPGTFEPDREVLRNSVYYYYVWSVAHAFSRLGLVEADTGQGEVRWAEALADELVRRQRADGAWTNSFTDAKEDDPLVATPWAAAALAVCRQVILAPDRLKPEDYPTLRPAVTSRAVPAGATAFHGAHDPASGRTPRVTDLALRVPLADPNVGAPAESEFSRLNPNYRDRAGAFYELEYLGKAVEQLAKTTDLPEQDREKVRAILRTFICDWLDSYVKGGGSISPQDLKRHLAVMDERFQGELAPSQYRAYLAWRSDANRAQNPLAFLMVPPPPSPAAPKEQANAATAAKDMVAKLLSAGDPIVRRSAAVVLGTLGDARAVEQLVVLLEDRDQQVQASALQVLRGIPGVVPMLIGEFGGARWGDLAWSWRVRKALVRIGEPALPPLREAFRTGNSTVRSAVASTLTEMGAPALPIFVDLLKEDRDEAADEARRWLSTRGTAAREAVPAIIEVLKDPRPKVRSRAAQALGHIGDRRALPALIAAMQVKEENWWPRSSAAWALGALGDRAASDPLLAALKGEDPHLRVSAAQALGMLKEARAVEPLLAMLSAPADRERRATVVQALGEIGDQRAVEPLIALLKDDDQHLRSRVVEALGALKDARAVAPLIDVLAAAKDEEERYKVTRALSRIADPRVAPVLIERLKDPSDRIRVQAADALGPLKDRAAIEPLLDALKDASAGVRAAGARALCYLPDDRLVSPMIVALDDPDSQVCYWAMQALTHTTDQKFNNRQSWIEWWKTKGAK